LTARAAAAGGFVSPFMLQIDRWIHEAEEVLGIDPRRPA
jgi:hypothetical protein